MYCISCVVLLLEHCMQAIVLFYIVYELLIIEIVFIRVEILLKNYIYVSSFVHSVEVCIFQLMWCFGML